jgi:RNA polymerase sigma-70 factor (ECF subfamily)
MTEQQWLKIYRETVHLLYGYIAKRTGGNKELTEDIVQESYLRALDDWKRKTVPDSPVAWLKRVAKNILIDFLRQKSWDKTGYLDRHPDSLNPSEEDQIKSLEIFLAISSLGRKKANILEAFYYEGKSTQEIADVLVISGRAVEGQLRRARHSLKSLLPEIQTNGEKNE